MIHRATRSHHLLDSIARFGSSFLSPIRNLIVGHKEILSISSIDLYVS